LGGVFSAALDTSLDATNDGSYVFQTGDVNPLAGNTGQSGGAANTLFVNVQNGATRANHVVEAINNDPTASALVAASIDPKDTRELAEEGTGFVATSAVASRPADRESNSTNNPDCKSPTAKRVIDVSGGRRSRLAQPAQRFGRRRRCRAKRDANRHRCAAESAATLPS
jgi:hypothetical protein